MGVKLCKNVHIFSWATVTVYIYTVTVACVYIILLISVRTNFSLSSSCTMTLAPHPLFLRCTQTHPHRQINTETHPHRQTNREIDRCLGSLVRGSADEEVIWVVELGSWVGQWRKDLGRGAWFVDRPVKKGSRSSELGSWIGQWRMDPVKKWSRLVVFERERER